jgi:Domain of unknown function (DUF1905)/Bacteriocin-protection, YdeI or OmpD-Associated
MSAKVKSTPKASGKFFEALLERGAGRLNWVIARIPFDVSEVWGTRAILRVKGYINNFEFRSSLFPTGDGHHVMLVNKKMQAGGKTGVGAAARFVVEPDDSPRTVTMPVELERALSEVRALRRWYDQLSPYTRKYTAAWVAGVKTPEARERRAVQFAERLFATMEAERELPPILRTAFARGPLAYEGWKQMSVARRRWHLLSIFYYRDPKAQARRAAQAVREAYERNQKSEARIKNPPSSEPLDSES